LVGFPKPNYPGFAATAFACQDDPMLENIDRRVARRRLRHRDKDADSSRIPDPSRAAGSDTLPQIVHIVVLMMENHSFDNYLGTLGRGEGMPLDDDGRPAVANRRSDGTPVGAHHLTTTVQLPDTPTQSWHASHIQYAGGGNDGFVRSVEETVPGRDPTVAMGYWTEADLPFYAGLARTYALADRWFASCLGPTFPNRRFLLAGTANGLIDDMAAGMIDYPRSGTIFDLLDRYGISWADYRYNGGWRTAAKHAVPGGLRGSRVARLVLGALVPRILSEVRKDLQFSVDLYPLGIWRCLRHLRRIDRFFADAAAGTLPAVSIVDPDFDFCSEENPQDIHAGEGFAAAVIDAVTHGKGWADTLLIWLYDEHGGYYDHVPPPAAVAPDDALPHSLLGAKGPARWVLRHLGMWRNLKETDSGAGRYDRYGFRVPAVVVSPYSRPGHVSSTVYDHTSILKLIELKWNLPPLTRRDAHATAPLDMVDLAAEPAMLTPPPLPPPAVPWARRPDRGT
jgi:phospholipase C